MEEQEFGLEEEGFLPVDDDACGVPADVGPEEEGQEDDASDMRAICNGEDHISALGEFPEGFPGDGQEKNSGKEEP